jgi:hypothetical protein
MTSIYSNSHKDFPKSGEALGQTRASAAHNSEIVYESRYMGQLPWFFVAHRAKILDINHVFLYRLSGLSTCI